MEQNRVWFSELRLAASVGECPDVEIPVRMCLDLATLCNHCVEIQECLLQEGVKGVYMAISGFMAREWRNYLKAEGNIESGSLVGMTDCLCNTIYMLGENCVEKFRTFRSRFINDSQENQKVVAFTQRLENYIQQKRAVGASADAACPNPDSWFDADALKPLVQLCPDLKDILFLYADFTTFVKRVDVGEYCNLSRKSYDFRQLAVSAGEKVQTQCIDLHMKRPVLVEGCVSMMGDTAINFINDQKFVDRLYAAVRARFNVDISQFTQRFAISTIGLTFDRHFFNNMRLKQGKQQLCLPAGTRNLVVLSKIIIYLDKKGNIRTRAYPERIVDEGRILLVSTSSD